MFNNYLQNLTLKTLIFAMAVGIFYNRFLHFGYKKTEKIQIKLIKKRFL